MLDAYWDMYNTVDRVKPNLTEEKWFHLSDNKEEEENDDAKNADYDEKHHVKGTMKTIQIIRNSCE